MPAPDWYHRDGTDLLVAVHAQPGAKKSAIAGLHGDALKIRIAAPPVDGRANEAIIAFLADRFGVARSAVSLERGDSARRKLFRIRGTGIDPASLIA